MSTFLSSDNSICWFQKLDNIWTTGEHSKTTILTELLMSYWQCSWDTLRAEAAIFSCSSAENYPVISHEVTQEWTNQDLNSYHLHCASSVSPWRDGKESRRPEEKAEVVIIEVVPWSSSQKEKLRAERREAKDTFSEKLSQYFATCCSEK